MEDMLRLPAASPLLSSTLGQDGCWDVLEVVDLLLERHPGTQGGLEYFTLALLLISSLSQAPDSIQSAQVPDWLSLSLVLGLH